MLTTLICLLILALIGLTAYLLRDKPKLGPGQESVATIVARNRPDSER